MSSYSFSSDELQSNYSKLCDRKRGLVILNQTIEVEKEALLLCHDLKYLLDSLKEDSSQKILSRGFVQKENQE